MEESGESWESTEGKVKEMFTEELQMDSPPAIEHAHRTGKDKKSYVLQNQEQLYLNSTIGRREKRSLNQPEESRLMESIFIKILLRKQRRSEENFFLN